MEKNTNGRPDRSREPFKLGIVTLTVARAMNVPIHITINRACFLSDEIYPAILERHSNLAKYRSAEMALTLEPLISPPAERASAPPAEAAVIENIF